MARTALLLRTADCGPDRREQAARVQIVRIGVVTVRIRTGRTVPPGRRSTRPSERSKRNFRRQIIVVVSGIVRRRRHDVTFVAGHDV